MKIYERKDLPTKKGNRLDFILRGKKVPTGYHCVAGAWDAEHQIVTTKDPNHRKLNKQLETATREITKLLHLPIEKIRLQYDSWFKSQQGTLLVKDTIVLAPRQLKAYDELTAAGKVFYMMIEKIIHSHRFDWSEGYKKRMRSLCTKVLAYDPHFDIDRCNEEWWRGFVGFCIEELENVSNTINTDCKAFKTLGKETGKDLNFSWGYIEPDIKGLSWDKVLKLYRMDSYMDLRDSRTLFLASAFTGRRWAEISTVGKENFYQDKGKWRYRNIGKGNKIVDIPLLPEAVEFFQKIDFTLPKVTNQYVNRDIKLICKAAGFTEKQLIITPVGPNKVIKEVKEEWETVHFHTARHSYCHHLVDLFAGKPGFEKTISWLMGHASLPTTWKYMNRTASSNEQLFEEVTQ
jgi:hypothetical protein